MRITSAVLVLASAAVAGCDRAPSLARRAHAAQNNESTGIRRVWANARDYAKPSPDGNLITFVDWSTGDVAVYDLATRAERRVTDKGTWVANGSWAEEPRFSPDGRRIVFSYGNTQAARPFLYELRVVTLGDTTMQLVQRVANGEFIVPLDWSERGGILAILDRANGASDLIAIDAATRSQRRIRSFARGEADPHQAAFSPDARYVAYQYGTALRVIGADGTNDGALDEQGTLLGWSADGAGVLFHGNRNGRRAIWLAPLRNGRRAGAITLVRDGIPALHPGGFSRAGYFYTVPVDGPRIQLATVDVENARVLVQPVQVTTVADGFASAPAWTPDGTSYAYILATPGMKPRIMLRSADGEQLRELALLEVIRVQSLRWEPNGRSLIVLGNGDAETAAYRVDAATGATRKLFEPAGAIAAVTPDGRTLVYLRSQGAYARGLDGGVERELLKLDGGGVTDIAVSPDGSTIAYVRRSLQSGSRLVLFPLAGGPEREIARLENPVHFEAQANTLAWTPDGRFLMAVTGDGEQNHRIVVVPASGGAPRTLIELGRRPEGPERAHAKLHRDGRRLVYSTGIPRSEMWVVDDLAAPRR